MALTNHDRVGKALELLKSGLAPFVAREMKAAIDSNAVGLDKVRGFADDPMLRDKPIEQWDVAALLKLMWDTWNEVFRKTLGFSERSLVSEIRTWRNAWAHQQAITGDDAYRALDSAGRLLTAVSAPEADEIEKAKMELLRVRFDEQARGQRRKSAGLALESGVASTLKPWREVVTPHEDVASGRYQQAEFAADLWQVHLGEGTPEYRDPVEFFRRTYLTDSLTDMLTKAVQRLGTGGGDPVVQLQTNFGGGKTHSMLALYHLFSGTPPTELAGIDTVMAGAGVDKVPAARRVVLVGNKISPGNPSVKPDGTVVRTLWGELAWQLGGKAAFARMAADDEKATSPGDLLRELFNEYGPCLVLIDEWVAYARQLHDQSDLPAGGFETQFSFAQALTESAKLAKNCLLVISLPASDTSGAAPSRADEVEVGGTRGREALDRLRNVVGRVESSWRPASAEEGFEIVRRRLFKPLADAEQFKQRDVVARAFADFYREHQAEFPTETRDPDYEKRIKDAYPIHPEIFDRLYTDWGTLVKFQRTRGVLRLMAAVIHSLWEKGDRNPLILPAHVAIDDARVQSELTRYLPDNWVPVIEKDVDGPNSLPLKLDGEVPNLGKFSACRRVARAIYMGSAPLAGAAHHGIEDRRVKLGCVMPGETPAVFGDALRRLAAAATYLYADGPRYWFSTQPTVTKLAEDRAEQLKRDADKVLAEIERRLRKDLAQTGDFSRVHPLPASGADVPDDLDTRLVVLGPACAHVRNGGSAAQAAASEILASRGNAPRLYQNTLVFLAPDHTRLQDLEDAARRFLAWKSILADEETLGLTAHQKRQVEQQIAASDSAAQARVPETYHWLLVPTQENPQTPQGWAASRLTGQDALAVRAAKKLRAEGSYQVSFTPSLLTMELDRIPLWRGKHVSIRQVVEDFARYPYLPRLKDPATLLQAMADGVGMLTWAQEGFGYADEWDEEAGRYKGLRAGVAVALTAPYATALLVKPDMAAKQLDADRAAASERAGGATASMPVPVHGGEASAGMGGTAAGGPLPQEPGPQGARQMMPTRFHATATLDTTRIGRDAGRIAEEIVAHLAGLMGAEVTVTLDIAARVPDGVPSNVVRVVRENCTALRIVPDFEDR